MDALLTAFVTAALAEWGDKTQLIVAMLAASTRRPMAILAGLFLAAVASSIIASIAGVYVAGMINVRAMSLMVALALLFGGLSGVIRRRPPVMGASTRVPVVAAFILCLAAEFADRTQFLTFAVAGRFDSAPLAAAGATAGIVMACLPAALLGERLQSAVPVRAIRYSVAGLFLLSGFIVAVNALQLS